MTLPPILPDWIPLWAQVALAILALLFALAFLMMPFAVFGLKGRFDLLEAQLDDIHAELRMLAMRLPDAEPQRLERRTVVEADDFAERQPSRSQERTHPLRAEARTQQRQDDGERSEPRLRRPPVR